ncbi:glycosyltransferase family 2 protein, partial [Campylobacter jejuni]|nr:glycosyltransferase family 2 protein [Campylobacter jejuni]
MENLEYPLISVIMPTFNREKYIKFAIESILNQTFTSFEFIIIDDCSNDATYDIIREYAKI